MLLWRPQASQRRKLNVSKTLGNKGSFAPLTTTNPWWREEPTSPTSSTSYWRKIENWVQFKKWTVSKNRCASPLPFGGEGMGGGGEIRLNIKKLQTPPLPLPLDGRGDAHSGCIHNQLIGLFFKWTQNWKCASTVPPQSVHIGVDVSERRTHQKSLVQAPWSKTPPY